MPWYVWVIIVCVVIAIDVVVLLTLRKKLGSAGVHVVRTKYGLGLVMPIEDEAGVTARAVNVGGLYQGATYLQKSRQADPVFGDVRLFDRAFEVRPDAGRVCVIGAGTYSWPKHLIASRPHASIDAVEPDARMTAIARAHFFLDECVTQHGAQDRLNTIEMEGRAFLGERAERAAEPYDVVCIDAFAGSKPVANLASVEAVRAARACLAPDGVLMTHVLANPGAQEGGPYLAAVMRTLSQEFAHVSALSGGQLPLSDRDSVVVLASDAEMAFDDALEVPGISQAPVITDEMAAKLVTELNK